MSKIPRANHPGPARSFRTSRYPWVDNPIVPRVGPSRLKQLLRTLGTEVKILMTASTHNAVDNVLERFAEMNRREMFLEEQQILRVATDVLKVNKSLQSFTIDTRVDGDMNENSKLFKRAQERLKAAVIVFTTCAGAGLGILRKIKFDIALIDEASQITESCALIPRGKGTRQAILVGDHATDVDQWDSAEVQVWAFPGWYTYK
ncbi:AAA domain-containing protein [Mycena capillaripes]|nr:AAA domain-containing protein [Mycena capillaripes]